MGGHGCAECAPEPGARSQERARHPCHTLTRGPTRPTGTGEWGLGTWDWNQRLDEQSGVHGDAARTQRAQRSAPFLRPMFWIISICNVSAHGAARGDAGFLGELLLISRASLCTLSLSASAASLPPPSAVPRSLLLLPSVPSANFVASTDAHPPSARPRWPERFPLRVFRSGRRTQPVPCLWFLWPSKRESVCRRVRGSCCSWATGHQALNCS